MNRILCNIPATALEFGSVSSDYVLLATATASNTAATLSIDGYFSTTYTRYYLFGYGIFSSSNASDLKFNLNVSGSADTGSKYVQTNSYQYTDENSSHNISAQATASGGSIDMNAPGTTWVANGDAQADDDATGSDCTLEIYNPYNNVRWKNVKWSHVFTRGDATTWQEFFGVGVFKETGYVSGVTVGVTAGNLTGTFKLYGVK